MLWLNKQKSILFILQRWPGVLTHFPCVDNELKPIFYNDPVASKKYCYSKFVKKGNHESNSTKKKFRHEKCKTNWSVTMHEAFFFRHSQVSPWSAKRVMWTYRKSTKAFWLKDSTKILSIISKEKFWKSFITLLSKIWPFGLIPLMEPRYY